MTFDFQKCLRNVYNLAKVQGKKIGDLEEAAGISRGYLSRLGKREDASFSIEPLAIIAEELGTTIDYLLHYDTDILSENEKVIANFLDVLQKKTISRHIEWIRDSSEAVGVISYEEPESNHPLFKVGIDDRADRYVYSLEYQSQFDMENELCDDSFRTEIGTHSVLYLMQVAHKDSSGNSQDEVELYLGSETQCKPLCCTYQIRQEIAASIRRLVSVIKSANSNIFLDTATANTLAAFIDGFK